MANNFQAEVEVFVDIPRAWILERDGGFSAALADKAIADFITLNDLISLDLWNGNIYPIQIEVFEASSRYNHFAKVYKKGVSRGALPCIFVRLSSKVTYTQNDLDKIVESDKSLNTFREYSLEERASIFLDSACSELHSTLIDLYLALSIAHPGSIYFWECWQFYNKNFVRKEHGAMTLFDNARKRSEELKWPDIHTLKIQDVYEWLLKVPGFSDRRGVGQVGRAIAALSYLIKMRSKDENALSLVWALLGLEALYGRGNVGLKTQLLEKSEAMLGPRQENKKVFGWMYDFRSRLLHGDMDLPYQHNSYDADPEYEKIWNELYECESLATAILLSTLQNLCQRNSYSLEFSYTLE
jgi:hypothetical protein